MKFIVRITVHISIIQKYDNPLRRPLIGSHMDLFSGFCKYSEKH